MQDDLDLAGEDMSEKPVPASDATQTTNAAANNHAPGSLRQLQVLPQIATERAPRRLASGKFVTTETLNNRTCKWPIGDPAKPGFHYCGQPPQVGQPYCDVHDRISYQPASRKKPLPAK